jgi:predicted component of viral defense system (DUF524 family)
MPLLLQASGAGWKLEIVGKLPELPPFIPIAPSSLIVSSPGIAVETLDRRSGQMRVTGSTQPVEPLFFEGIGYDVHFERENPSYLLTLPPGAELRRERPSTVHFVLNFGNNVGLADLSVTTAAGSHGLRLEVFSRKVDYRKDYVTMVTEVSAVLRNLAMAASAKTYGLASPAKDHYPTLVEWFALIQSHFANFIKLAGAIASNPHSGLREKVVPVNTERARRVTRQTIARSLRKLNGGACIPGFGVALPRRIHENVASPTFDTPENRYYKALIKETYRNLHVLSKTSFSGDEDADRFSERRFFESIRPTLKEMERKLEAILRSPFLGQVTDSALVRPRSMVFYKHPLYSRFDKLCRLLNGGLSSGGNIIPIGIKETSLLYEYWCFLKIVTLLRDNFELTNQSVVQFKRLRATVALAKGRSSALRFVHKASGKPLFLIYNRIFNRLPTIDQKPDNVIQFATENRFFIFDAKYRIQFDRDYACQYGGPGPTTEDVNTMHRYRDAIVIPHPLRPDEYLKSVVVGAVVLFPYPDETKYRDHHFYKSIGRVEIGGLPFLPNATTLVADKIDILLRSGYPSS